MQLDCLDYALWRTTPGTFVRELRASVARNGFLALANHPLKPALRARAFAAMRDFFALPLEQKNRINIDRSPNHRGYFAPWQERLDPAQYPQGDNKEGIKIGRDLPPTHPLVQAGLPLHGPNQWPESEEFVQVMQALFAACLVTSRQLMDALGMALGLERGYFTAVLDQPMATLTPLHYPPLLDAGHISAGAHTDFGCLTLVLQDGTAGLEVWDKENKNWLAAPADEQLLIVNVGDMLERWSNNSLPSTPHRVRASAERYSIAFFFDPNHDALIAPLPGTYDAHNPPHHQPIKALEYLQQRIGASFGYFAAQEQTITEAAP